MIEIVSQGIGSTYQDLGRPGCTHLGVGRSGAADRPSHRLANRLVGNDESATTIETCGGLTVRLLQPAVVAVTGAQGVIDVRHGRPMAVNGVEHQPAGAELTMRAPDDGMRYYLAIRGGLEVEPVLGSRSFDSLAGLGPRLSAGDRVEIGPDPMTPITTDFGVHLARTTLDRPVGRAPARLVHRGGVGDVDDGALRGEPIRETGSVRVSADLHWSAWRSANCSAKGWWRVLSRCLPMGNRS